MNVSEFSINFTYASTWIRIQLDQLLIGFSADLKLILEIRNFPKIVV